MKTLRGSSYQLSDLLEGMPGGPELAFRDFALVTIGDSFRNASRDSLSSRAASSCGTSTDSSVQHRC
jgi:hypothetical protein